MVDMRAYLKEEGVSHAGWSQHSAPRTSYALCHCQICVANKKEVHSRGNRDRWDDLISDDRLKPTLNQCFLFPKRVWGFVFKTRTWGECLNH
jgi:hypothetical protein